MNKEHLCSLFIRREMTASVAPRDSRACLFATFKDGKTQLTAKWRAHNAERIKLCRNATLAGRSSCHTKHVSNKFEKKQHAL